MDSEEEQGRRIRMTKSDLKDASRLTMPSRKRKTEPQWGYQRIVQMLEAFNRVVTKIEGSTPT